MLIIFYTRMNSTRNKERKKKAFVIRKKGAYILYKGAWFNVKISKSKNEVRPYKMLKCIFKKFLNQSIINQVII